jgi:hypothetical protein
MLPQKTRKKRKKAEFYSNLERICTRAPKYNLLKIMGISMPKQGGKSPDIK